MSTNTSKCHETEEMLCSDLTCQGSAYRGQDILCRMFWSIQHEKHISFPKLQLCLSPYSSHHSIFTWRFFFLFLLTESLEDSGAASKTWKIWDGYHAAHVYYKILLSLKWIARKILNLLLKAFLKCFHIFRRRDW